MREYKDLYTEDENRASVYRHSYLESVLKFAESTSDIRKKERENYITPEKLKVNREKYLSDFKSVIGTPLFYRTVKNEVQKVFVSCDEQGSIYRLVFNFEKGIKFYGLLFVPYDAKSEKLPLITAIHGGEGTPELISDIYGKNYYSHITRRLLERNAVVFAPQLLIWDGKRFGDTFNRFETDAKFKALGSSMTSFECECIMGALDYLLTLDFVDNNRVGITGLSYGGYYSIVTAILDTRIKAVYSSCVFNDRMKYSRPDFVYSGMSDKFLDAEMTALIYPRAIYIEAGKTDCFFSVDGAENEYDRLKAYYSDNPDNLVFKTTELGHRYDDLDDGIEFLFKKL